MSYVETRHFLLNLAVQIVVAQVGHNDTSSEELPNLIRSVHETLSDIAASSPVRDVSDRGNVHVHGHPAQDLGNDDLLVCLEDGLKMKMLKRHLMTVHGLTPEDYREKWGLPDDYPMVATNYAKLRSSLAKESGLGLRPEARRKLRMG